VDNDKIKNKRHKKTRRVTLLWAHFG